MSNLPHDWRVWITAEATTPNPWGPFILHDRGRVTTVTRAKAADYGVIVFATPNPAMLSLGVAIQESHRVQRLRRSIIVRLNEQTRVREVTLEDSTGLYDFFSACMVVTTFSFQTLEAFANDVIDRADKGDGDTFTVTKRNGECLTVPSEGIERLSTEEKFGWVLKEAFGLPALKHDHKKLWQRFQQMKAVRDSTTHTKSQDHYVHHKQPRTEREPLDQSSIYYRFLNNRVEQFPRTVLDILRVFSHPDSEPVFAAAEALLEPPAMPAVRASL